MMWAFFILCFSCNTLGSPHFDWSEEALKLTGESEQVRENALKKLKRHPKIKKLLKLHLKTAKKALALDVITALQDRSFVPLLLKLAPDDDTGGMYLTINSLITPQNAKKIISAYGRQVLVAKNPASQVALLDTLGMAGVALRPDKLAELLKNPSYEVRSAVMSYSRLMILKYKKKKYLDLLAPALQTSPYQLRLQTVYLISELGKPHRALKKDLKTLCGQDPNDEVRSSCLSLLAGEG